MSINISLPNSNETPEMKPRITVFGVGGAGGNAVNNMIESALEGVEFVVANTDAQALALSRSDRRVQLGVTITQGLGAGSRPDIGRGAAEEAIEEILEHLNGSHMAFITAGMGGGTGTGAAPVIASAARERGILTVGVVTKPFSFEGTHRMRIAEQGIEEMERFVDTLIIIPNQNLFRVANEKTTFADAFTMADDVLYSGVRGVTDLMVMPGLINLDFADIRAIMSEMGKAMMGTGEAEGERRALDAAEAAIANPLLDDISMNGATGILINITGGPDMTLFEVDEAANRIRSEVDPDAHIIFGSTFDDGLDGRVRVSIVATGMSADAAQRPRPATFDVVPQVKSPLVTDTLPAAATILPLASDDATAEIVGDTTSDSDSPAATEADSVETAGSEETQDSSTLDDMAPAGSAEAKPVSPVEEPRRVGIPRRPAAAETAKPPAATPAIDAVDAFIPPAPVDPTAGDKAPQAEPFAAAAMANGGVVADPETGRPRQVNKGLSLFERVTGTGRASSRPSQTEAEDESTAEATPPAAETNPAPATLTALEGTADPQPVLGGLDPSDRLPGSQEDEDLLDIPAFLRRQAN